MVVAVPRRWWTRDDHGQNTRDFELAFLLICLSSMRRPTAHRQPMRLLRWIFQRGNQTLTCQVDQRPGDQTYTLSLAPHSNVGEDIAETFNSAWSALRRHAVIASELRRSGWTLAAYTAD
jgi:hypothetical protein